MADSETSRTLPAISRGKKASQGGIAENLPDVIDRRNLLAVAARLLSEKIADPVDQPRGSGPTPVREMWPRWYACHQQQVRTTQLRRRLEAQMLKAAGSLPVAELQFVADAAPVVVHSLADIKQLASQVDSEELSRAKAELCRRRKQWKEADQRLRYSVAAALEQKFVEQAGIFGRVMWITRPSSLTEVTAKLHCMIVMRDPDLKLEDAPWPELRTMLKDLIRVLVTSGEDACASHG